MRSLLSGNGSALGDDVGRLLGSMSLDRVSELLHGVSPKTHAEPELVAMAGVQNSK
jgi:hypothetical protein